mgnify:CR=1 FL=1|jgi:hypothetical protein
MQLAADGDATVAAARATSGGSYHGGGINLLLRHQLCVLATADLKSAMMCGEAPPASVLELLARAVRRCSASSAELAAGATSLSVGDLSVMQAELAQLRGLIDQTKQLTVAEHKALQPPEVSEIRGDVRYPYFDRLCQRDSVEDLAGKERFLLPPRPCTPPAHPSVTLVAHPARCPHHVRYVDTLRCRTCTCICTVLHSQK